MQEELDQFKRNEVWELVPRPKDKSIIGTKWVFKNKFDENKNIIRNKAKLVVKGYYQEEDIDFEESYASVARLEGIRMLLTFASHMNFMLYQMDVKGAFINDYINKEVYVIQPSGFEDLHLRDHIQNQEISLKFVLINLQLADIFLQNPF